MSVPGPSNPPPPTLTCQKVSKNEEKTIFFNENILAHYPVLFFSWFKLLILITFNEEIIELRRFLELDIELY